jgi:hypothetical protein
MQKNPDIYDKKLWVIYLHSSIKEGNKRLYNFSKIALGIDKQDWLHQFHGKCKVARVC